MRSRISDVLRAVRTPGAAGAASLSAAALLVLLLSGCGQVESGAQGTGRTVRQEKHMSVNGLGGYRSVEMPERARQNLVEAKPDAPGAAAYRHTLANR